MTPVPDVRTSKLRVPLRKSTHVDRPRLEALLGVGQDRRLTLVAAPAGFGKTTLLAACAASADVPVAWISLDAGDDDPVRFLHHLLTALARIAPAPSELARAAFEAQPHPSVERVIGTFVDALDTGGCRGIVAFDDFHVITSAEVVEGVAALVAGAHPSLHVVIATRTDPPLAIARLRARGELLEIRARELRFTTAEAAALLRAHGAPTLSTDQVASLEQRTDGWAAGLQLVGSALARRRAGEARAASGVAASRRAVQVRRAMRRC